MTRLLDSAPLLVRLKTPSHALRLLFLGLVFSLGIIVFGISGCGGGGGGDVGAEEISGTDEDYPDYMVGPPGKVLELTEPANPGYGVIVEIAPGQLDAYRTFYLTDDRFNVPVTPWLPAGFLSGSRRNEGAFAVKTSGDPPYEVEMTLTFPLSDTDAIAAPGEVLCAFYLDKAEERWRFVLPTAIAGNSMTVVTTYRETWNWGRVNVNELSREYLEPALQEQMSESEWAAILASIEDTRAQIETQNVSFTSCQSLRAIQGGLLATIKERARLDLLDAQPQFDGVCGSCDPLSSLFRSELEDFVEYNIRSWVYELAADHIDNIVVELAFRINLLIIDFQIRNMACDYSCVHEQAGIGFWVDFGEYYFAGGLQYMIEWYIYVSEMECP